MGTAHRQGTGTFATVWTATWLRHAPYRRRLPSLAVRAIASFVTACIAPGRARSSGADYFSRVADIPGLAQSYKVRALAIVMHQRREAALQRLVAADEA